MGVSERVRKIRREQLGLTQLEFAHVVGVDPITVSRWERGISEPELSNIRRIAKLAGLPVSAFFEEAA